MEEGQKGRKKVKEGRRRGRRDDGGEEGGEVKFNGV